MDDEQLLQRAEQVLTEIKVNQGLSEHHASLLAALRIRLKGSAGGSLDELLEAADDPTEDDASDSLDARLAAAERRSKPSLDDLLNAEPEPKPEWPS